MIKVLQVLKGGDEFGGVESFICQYYKEIDHTNYHFDFLFCYGDSMKDKWDDPFLYESIHKALHLKKNNMFQLYLYINQYLKETYYDCVHVNTGNVSIQVPVLLAAKKNKIRIRIAHSHSTGPRNSSFGVKNILIKIMKLLIIYSSTKMVACSVEAAERLYGKKIANNKAIIIPNSIDVKKYKYDNSIRCLKKQNLGVSNKKIYIQIGNLLPVKNHDFSIRLFKRILEKEKDSVFIIVGKGLLENDLKNLVIDLGIEKNVIFLGYRDDVNELLQAADIMLMPSKWEGLGMAAIEAQVSGTTVLCSDSIPRSVNITGKCIFLPLNIDEWEKECITATIKKEDYSRMIIDNGYDVNNAKSRFSDLYA